MTNEPLIADPDTDRPQPGRLRPDLADRLWQRGDMAVQVAIWDGSSNSSAPDLDLVTIAEAQRRFAICRTCSHSCDGGFACDLYTGCCFGRYRSDQHSQCPKEGW